MNKIAFLIPIYPPHFKYATNLIDSWRINCLDEQSDLWFIFTNEDEKNEFGDYKNSIILPTEFRNIDNNSVINIKKLYGLKQIKNNYNYVIVADSEIEFIRNIDLKLICENYYNNKILLGNKTGLKLTKKSKKRMLEIKKATSEYFTNYKNSNILLKNDLYLWFNQPCIYKTDLVDDFFEKIDYENNIKNIKWADFDYYLFMNYLILFHGFNPIDIGIKAKWGAMEATSFETFKIENDNYKKYNIYQCTPVIWEKLDNPNLFILIHKDRCKMITSNDISVVVQGAIQEKYTKECLNSIRKCLPRAEIIFSTYEGNRVDGLEYDKLILNKVTEINNREYPFEYHNNINKQIISTREGIKKAKRKYILKLNNDLILKSSKFLLYWNKYKKNNTDYALFNHKLIGSGLYSEKLTNLSQNDYTTNFMISDLWVFGLNEDVLSFFLNHPLSHDDINDSNFIDRVLYNNFIFLEYKQSGIYSKKYKKIQKNESNNLKIITFEKFQQQYRDYCDNNYLIKNSPMYYKHKLKTHFVKFLTLSSNFKFWFDEILSVIFYLFAIVFTFLKFRIGKR